MRVLCIKGHLDEQAQSLNVFFDSFRVQALEPAPQHPSWPLEEL